MKSIRTSAFLWALVIISAATTAQSKTLTTETFKVSGNCAMCKSTIEKAVNKNNDAKGKWNEETKMLVVNYDANTTSSLAILKRVADAGHDNEKFVAHASAYDRLHSCCKYDRKETAINTKESKINDAHEDHNAGEMPTKNVEEPAKEIENHEGHNHTTLQAHTDNKETSQQIVQIKKDTGLTVLLTNYYNIKNALVKTDGAAASAKATEFVTAIKAIDMNKMTEAEHNVFMPLQQKLIADAEQIAATKDVERQRDRFNDFSNNMFALAKAMKLSAPVYQQYCPMKKTYWLSEEAAIKNPYYGKEMLTCGNVSATLK